MDAPRPESVHAALDPSISGPLSVEKARAMLERADELMASSDFSDAARYYQRVVGHPSAEVTAAALLGLGEALYRLDQDAAALSTWRSVFELPETRATYAAWRNVAAALVRAGDMHGAADAYRQAERRAPPGDRAEIASRLGWLTKELGDRRAAGRYFARARGDQLVPATFLLIGLTCGITVAAWLSVGSGLDLYGALQLDKAAVANGEYWRLLTVALLHAPLQEGVLFALLHLGFNMFALYLLGPVVERFYGPVTFVLLYLLTAAAGSVASFVFSDATSVGASGAVFGLVGVLIAAQRVHDPMVDRQTRQLIAQLVPLVIINLVFNLFAGFVDIAAHVGGLAAGLWLGWLLMPARVTTLATRWQDPGGTMAREGPARVALRWLGVLALVVAIVVGIATGTDARHGTGPIGPTTTATVPGAPSSAGRPRPAPDGGS
jgi:membrane associated rhomboid family serine protease